MKHCRLDQECIDASKISHRFPETESCLVHAIHRLLVVHIILQQLSTNTPKNTTVLFHSSTKTSEESLSMFELRSQPLQDMWPTVGASWNLKSQKVLALSVEQYPRLKLIAEMVNCSSCKHTKTHKPKNKLLNYFVIFVVRGPYELWSASWSWCATHLDIVEL